ncbi:hypothetical protein [Actinoplanes awajinensis]|uniref:Uncharacterized protein n=1 Tax=Actinoplanes awajinensis subsp. mycoplanecinus TaxID=135947 RepID=A0A117MNW0_9ACTN|nr:hypothetical protein [Actinoplanes awajinensis]KUL27686.1 hypothetical protein ADL15_34620 [Actinoplanes awajinensis subsp. mycoplanecinus]
MSFDDAGTGARPRARHRRPHRSLTELAGSLWRRALGLAVVLFAACGPAHAFGQTDLVFHTTLLGLALAGLAVPLGLAGLRHEDRAD